MIEKLDKGIVQLLNSSACMVLAPQKLQKQREFQCQKQKKLLTNTLVSSVN